MADVKVLLAKPFDPAKHDPTGWWGSEKLDGIRAVWQNGELFTRNGNRIAAPSWFTSRLPDLKLDGELWAGRGNFQDATSIVRCSSQDKGWSKISYMVFDSPSLEPFETRMATIHRAATAGMRVVEQTKCTGHPHLAEMMRKIVKGGGEGLMLREPGSRYEYKRSSTLLKVKEFQDCEATVIGHVPGKGKHEGRLGALECRLRDGTTFEVGTGFTDREREHPPKRGSTITVRYQELSRDGVPRFPVYVTERDYE